MNTAMIKPMSRPEKLQAMEVLRNALVINDYELVSPQ